MNYFFNFKKILLNLKYQKPNPLQNMFNKTLFRFSRKSRFIFRFLRFYQVFRVNQFSFSSPNGTPFHSNQSEPSIGNLPKNDPFSLDEMKKSIIDMPFEECDLPTKDLCHNPIMASTKVLPNVEEKIKDAKIYVTPERKEFILRMNDVLKKSILTQDYNKKHILTGCEGIGKSCTLFLLVDKFRKNKNLKVVYIPNCYHIMERGWVPIIEEFMFTFPDENKELEKLISMKPKPSELEIISKLEDILRKCLERNELPIFVLDQINFILDPQIYAIFKSLTLLPWKLQIYSQSANNEVQKELKFFQSHVFSRMIPLEEIKKLIKNKKAFNDMKCTEDDIEKVINLVGTTPREIDRIFECPGDTINQKILGYNTKRKREIENTHKRFLSSLNQSDQNELFEAIFFMDRDIGLKTNLKIDQQLMINEFNPKTDEFKIKSSFSFASQILKEIMEKRAIHVDKDFFNKRIQSLNEMIKDTSLTPGTRGGLYEEIIHTSFQRAFHHKLKINLVGHTLNYLKYAEVQNTQTEKLQSIQISFSLDNFYSIWTKNQLIEKKILDNMEQGKNFYVRFEKTTEKALEAGIFLSPQNRVITKSNNTVKSLDVDLEIGDYIFAGIQDKKDTVVYEDIIKKWFEVKKEIENLMANKMKIQKEPIKVKFVLFLFNESLDRKTGKQVIWNIQGKEDVIVFFSDIKNEHFFK